MKNKYIDLIEQTFYFPRHGFDLANNELSFHDIPLVKLIEEFGSPLKFTYLPKIDMQIQTAKQHFTKAIDKYKYKGNYTYCYCTKSSHFSFIIERALRNDIGLETSSAYDLDIINHLNGKELFEKNKSIVCNGYKTNEYAGKIVEMVKSGFTNLTAVIDNVDEIDKYTQHNINLNLGIRIATEEEPNTPFYTSRLGMSSKKIKNFYQSKIKDNPNYKLKMLHFFVNTGIKDTTYYWSELARLVNVYCDVKQYVPELESLDIGGGMPIYNTLGIEHDYEYMIDQVVMYIKTICEDRGVPEPHIFSEFGQYTVGESGGMLYSIIGQKEQNDKELWYMIDSSFITTLPDTWGIGQQFILLALNHWDKPFKRINLGGVTCDSQDFYTTDSQTNQVFMPAINDGEKLYMGFFHTGAYQESIGGYGGIQHCLIPAPKHVLIDKVDGKLSYKLFAPQQNAESMLNILGY
ncbi:MAG: arginine decarboxylase [bacterium]